MADGGRRPPVAVAPHLREVLPCDVRRVHGQYACGTSSARLLTPSWRFPGLPAPVCSSSQLLRVSHDSPACLERGRRPPLRWPPASGPASLASLAGLSAHLPPSFLSSFAPPTGNNPTLQCSPQSGVPPGSREKVGDLYWKSTGSVVALLFGPAHRSNSSQLVC